MGSGASTRRLPPSDMIWDLIVPSFKDKMLRSPVDKTRATFFLVFSCWIRLFEPKLIDVIRLVSVLVVNTQTQTHQ